MQKRGSIFSWLTVAIITVTTSLASLIVEVVPSIYYNLVGELPSTDNVKNYHPPLVTTIYAEDGTPISEFYKERRYYVPLKNIPDHVVKAFLAAEDARFYEHQGVDPLSILRAFIVNLKSGTITQGGSTITQQVIKSLLLTPERTWQRKIREAILAYQISKYLSKDEILEIYLNQLYFGSGAYGVEAASRAFFGKHVQELTIAEAAMLAGLPKAPSKYNPYDNFNEARKRQLYVIQRMEEERFISHEEAEYARQEKINLAGDASKPIRVSNHFVEEVKRRIIARYGERAFYEEGLHIFTTYNHRLQTIAEKILSERLKKYDDNYPTLNIIPKSKWKTFIDELKLKQSNVKEGQTIDGLIIGHDDKNRAFTVVTGTGVWKLEEAEWKKTERSYEELKQILEPGAVIKVSIRTDQNNNKTLTLEQSLRVEGAFLLAETKTGNVLAMVGSQNFNASQFNRATQARRQPGSAFKPIVYAVAIDKGYDELSIVEDSPVSYTTKDGTSWSPSNYDGSYLGPMTLRKALALSRNTVTVKLAEDVGLEDIIKTARKLGIESDLSDSLALALGSSGVSLYELTQAYSVFANNGTLIPFRMITKVIDRYGNVIEEFPITHKKALSPDTAYIITDMLMAVVQEGTGKPASILNGAVAGKTGTSNEFRDAWFIGYTPDYVAGIWIGYDDNTASLGQGATGGKVACPIWTDIMKEWLQDKPSKTFTVPPEVVLVKAQKGNKIAYIPVKKHQVTSKDDNDDNIEKENDYEEEYEYEETNTPNAIREEEEYEDQWQSN